MVAWTFQPDADLPEKVEQANTFAQQIGPETTKARYEEAVLRLEGKMMVARYSHRTIKAYKSCFRHWSNLNPYATVHTLRHSFATHLCEKGVDLRYVRRCWAMKAVRPPRFTPTSRKKVETK